MMQHMQASKSNTEHKHTQGQKYHNHIKRWKGLSQIQCAFMIAPRKLCIEGICLNILEAIYNKPIANVILNVGKFESISFKMRRVRIFSTLS